LIAKMRELYGRKFDQQWDGVDVESLANTVAECLDGLSIAELQAGVNRMMREPWPPTIPEFRSWCEQGGTWMTADEAWASALAYVADPKTQITVQAKAALTKVRCIIDNEGQKAAARAFKDIYARRMSDDKAAGVSQSIAPRALPKVDPVPDLMTEQQRKANLSRLEQIKQQIGGGRHDRD
jgi:hypothetical protein